MKEAAKAFKIALTSNQRDLEIEKIISKSPSYSVLYAKRIINDRFILGEKTIANNSYYVCAYLSELYLKEVPIDIHRIMLSRAIEKNGDYWTKQYFKFCDFVDGKENKPWWYSDAMNWNYGKATLLP